MNDTKCHEFGVVPNGTDFDEYSCWLNQHDGEHLMVRVTYSRASFLEMDN